jgi:hypothetical protein
VAVLLKDSDNVVRVVLGLEIDYQRRITIHP